MRLALLFCIVVVAHDMAYAEDTAQVYVSEGELNYIGSLDKESNQGLFALYDSLNTKPTTLAIRSRGGDVVLGMELGEWVHAHRLNVKVMEFCLSSCANYVFSAGARKIVSSHAMVGFHGGLSSSRDPIDATGIKGYESLTDTQKADINAQLKQVFQLQAEREAAFFNRVGVRQDLTTYGQQERFANVVRDGWTFTQKCFGHFGVDNIEVINPPWSPRLLTLKTEIATLDCSDSATISGSKKVGRRGEPRPTPNME